ncbi:hypothetical protein Aeqsu_0208 [Aequorivita sublithincola DSM 14238]|uniref:Uncharacterized protein n=1 Tax=Aequorivita sublithincola (strain DSM 14238 / LMG 21431 / ACAM 643 / 9-3) TaxID=746697 RepID=I3YRW3_AEQSU|nr:hypothetical protein [Aequorivita sublithincola]AFL79731.1 hypothetical protein Aeqsu_0208 [Aequorivita sublithincola DSM 14238]
MAKQTGTIKLKGTIDGINYYKSKVGGHLARAAGGGFSKNPKNKESLVRTMENATEFGRCSRTKKVFRIALAPFLCVRKDGALHGRMIQLFTKLKNLDPVNSRGKRCVGEGLRTPLGVELLGSFVFTPSCNVIEVLAASLNFDFNTRTLSVSNFDVKNVSFPAGATHIALTLGLLHFDFNTLEFSLKNSSPLYMDKQYSATSFEMNTELPDVGGFAVAVLGMKFYQKVESTYYLFKSANAVGVDVLGVEV